MSLLDEIRELTENPHDGFIFSPHPEQEELTHIEIFTYKEQGIDIEGCDLGKRYEIVFLKLNEEYDLEIDERFCAILTDPAVYIAGLIERGFYGVVGRKTSTSHLFFDSLLEPV